MILPLGAPRCELGSDVAERARTPPTSANVDIPSRCPAPWRWSLGRLGAAVPVLAILASVVAVVLAASTDPVDAQESGNTCSEGDSVRVLFLLDTSRSLRRNDPENRRTTGAIDALEDLYAIVGDYRSRLRRHYPEWSVFAAIDTFSGFHTDPELNSPYGRRSGDWKDLASLNNLAQLRQAARGVPQSPGYWTDYREALRGVVERFEEPVPGGMNTCDYLFWFTDGDHDTVSGGVFTAEEEEHIDEMCRAGGLVDRLRQTRVNVTAIELRVDRESSEQLHRLVVGRSSDCAGLGGKVADVASVADLATRIEEIVFRLVDPDFPAELVDPCGATTDRCDYRFSLAEGIEWVKVYVDLAGVHDSDEVDIVLHGPDGRPIAPFRFGEEWAQVANTGLLGRRPTPNISVIWAHRVSEQEYGTAWGGGQEWTIQFSGSGAAQARAGTRKDERGTASIHDLEVSGSDLTGRISPAPSTDESARLVFHLDDGRYIDISEASSTVRSGGRFTVPEIVDRIVSTVGGDNYLAANNCVAFVDVSLAKTIDYGGFSGTWDAPLLNSTVGVGVPRALCGLSGSKPPLLKSVEYDGSDPFDPSGALRVVADGGLLDGVLHLREVHLAPGDDSTNVQLPSGWPEAWTCPVAADAEGTLCEDLLRFELSADSDATTDIRLLFSSTTVDPFQVPPVEEVRTYVLRDVPVQGKLPGPFAVEIDNDRPRGFLAITGDAGTQDGVVTVERIEVTGLAGLADPASAVQVKGEWVCQLPANATGYSCPPLPIFSESASVDGEVDLVVSLRESTSDPSQGQPSRSSEHLVRDVSVPQALPVVMEVNAGGPTDPPGSLSVTAQGGVLDGIVRVESAEVFVGTGFTEDPPNVRMKDEWTCSVPSNEARFACPMLQVFTDSADDDAVVALVVAFEVLTYDSVENQLSRRSEYLVRDVTLPSALPAVMEVNAGGPADPPGSLSVAAQGGVFDGIVRVESAEVFVGTGFTEDPPNVRMKDEWTCSVPSNEARFACPMLQVFTDSADDDAVVALVVAFEVLTYDSVENQLSRRSEYLVRDVTLPSALPAVSDVTVARRFDPSGSLRVIAQGGVLDGVVTVDVASGGVLSVESADGPVPELRPESEWSCAVPAGAIDYECFPLPVSVAVDGDSTVDVVIPLREASVDSTVTATRTRSLPVTGLNVGVRAPGEILAKFVPYLLVLLLAIVVMRVFAAWSRRRWGPLSTGKRYYVATGRIERDRDPPEGSRIQPNYCDALTRSVGSATLERCSVVLRIPWWPLIFGGGVRILASSREQNLVAGGGKGDGGRSSIRRERGGGVLLQRRIALGGSLQGGWIVVKRGENHYQLAYWDVPQGEGTAEKRESELWQRFHRELYRDPTVDESRPTTEVSAEAREGAGTYSGAARAAGPSFWRRRDAGRPQDSKSSE